MFRSLLKAKIQKAVSGGGFRLYSSAELVQPSCTTEFYPVTSKAKVIKHIHFPHQLPYQLGNKIQEFIVSKNLEYKKHQILSRNPKYVQPTTAPQPIPSSVLTFEFNPVYTGGKREKIHTTFEKQQAIQSLKHVPYVQTSRGGQVTFHGPGQAVIYPILDLSAYHKLTSKCYVSTIEKSVVGLLRSDSLGLDALTTENTGVWVKDPTTSIIRKVSSIGVNVRRSITSHGVSINCGVNLDYVNDPNVVMCGLDDFKQTSVEAELKRLATRADFSSVDVAFVAKMFVDHLASRLSVTNIESHVADFTQDQELEIFKWLDEVVF
ncbi:hypothetical protein CANARDRAFT_29323 [[Candida] arabinofermentans NRRL YB-2248]|uniref:lipoyl(octanoyl) transferase n=1 Tax=[Candida] arabinofermentans NRRL YB-2248 TaxID=983967 RepID=A0A1E4SXD2_9ASCO|nr:hypothetical protein CANARDRAFT_29323 [[Candida] arabinofermentans NRRL YB-2248]